MHALLAFLIFGSAHATSPIPPTASDVLCYDAHKRSNLQFQISRRFEGPQTRVVLSVKTYDGDTGRSIGWAQQGTAEFRLDGRDGGAQNAKGETLKIEELSDRLNQHLPAKPRWLENQYTPRAELVEALFEAGDAEYPMLVVRSVRVANAMTVAVMRVQKGSSWSEQVKREQDELDRTGTTGRLRLVMPITTYDMVCTEDMSYRKDIPVLVK